MLQVERLDVTYYQGEEAVNVSMLTRATHTLHGFEPNVCSKLVQVRVLPDTLVSVIPSPSAIHS